MRQKLEGLSYELVDAKPRPFTFSNGYGQTWDIAFPLTNAEFESETYFPIYDFVYPLGDGFALPRDVREKLCNTTVVRLSDACYLALTGCGMDMTWEIAETYINLGYFPPAHFSRLPEMADRGVSNRDRFIASACRESLDALICRAVRDRDRLESTYLVSEKSPPPRL